MTALEIMAGETRITPDSAGLIALNPAFLAPGATEITVAATTDNGLTGEASMTVLIGALPPEILVSGITPDENLVGDVEISVDTVSQTPITSLIALVDGESAAELEGDPAVFTLSVLDFAPGEHVLTIGAENASGQTSTLDIPFTIDPAPAASATFAAQMEATATQVAIGATADC